MKLRPNVAHVGQSEVTSSKPEVETETVSHQTNVGNTEGGYGVLDRYEIVNGYKVLKLYDDEKELIVNARQVLNQLLGEDKSSKILIMPKYIKADPDSPYISHQKGGWTVEYQMNGKVLSATDFIELAKQ